MHLVYKILQIIGSWVHKRCLGLDNEICANIKLENCEIQLYMYLPLPMIHMQQCYTLQPPSNQQLKHLQKWFNTRFTYKTTRKTIAPNYYYWRRVCPYQKYNTKRLRKLNLRSSKFPLEHGSSTKQNCKRFNCFFRSWKGIPKSFSIHVSIMHK